MSIPNYIHPGWYEPAFSEIIRRHKAGVMAPDLSTFGKWLTWQLARHNVTTVILAAKIGKSESTVKHLRNDKVGPSLQTMADIGVALGLEPSETQRGWQLAKGGRK